MYLEYTFFPPRIINEFSQKNVENCHQREDWPQPLWERMGDDCYGNQESLWKHQINLDQNWTQNHPKKKTKQFYYHSLLQMQKKI